MPFFYSPVSLGLFLPFALLAQQAGVRVSALVWDGFKLLLLWWTLRWATRWVSLSADRLHIATLLWLPIISDFSLGQVNITFLAIFSAALATSEQWRGFLLGIGFHLKGLLLAPLAVLLGRGRKSAFLWGLAGLAIPMLLFALLDLSLLYFYFAQRFLPLILSPVKPVTDPDLLLLIGTSHLHFPPLLRATSLVIGGLVALLVRREREALVVMAGTAALFSGVAERGHLLLLLPALWLLLEAAQEGRLSAFAYGLGLAGFLIFTIGNLSSLATIDLPRLLGLTTRISPVAFASPILGSLFTLEWFCATFDPGDSAT